MTATNHNDAEQTLESLIERSAELKGALVDFACSPRLERHLTRFMQKSASPGDVLDEGDAAGLVDRFALQHRLPNGKTVIDQFLASRPDLSAADRDMMRGWRDPVEGVFEIRGKDRTAIVLLNLLDDLEYRTYSNMGPAAFRQLPKGGFLYARLVPISPVPGAWLVSGYLTAFPKSGAAQVAQVALQLATTEPELVFRNPEKIEQGWKQMREDRAAFIEFFGSDELVLSPAEAAERLDAYYRHRRQAVLAAHPERRKPRRGPDTDLPPSNGQPSSPKPTPSASSTTRSTASTSTTTTGCSASCSPTRLWRRTSGTRTCCADTSNRTPSARCRSAASPSPTPRRPTRCSARYCASPASPGPTTAKHCCDAGSPGTTNTSHAPASP